METKAVNQGRCRVTESASGPAPPDKRKERVPPQRRSWKVICIAPSVKKELVPLKVVLFCWYGAFSSLLPYMTIYLKQLGVTASEIAFIYTFFPIAKLLGPAVGGLIADKLGRYKPVLYVALACNVFFATSFLFIPAIPRSTCQSKGRLDCENWQKPRLTLEEPCFGRNRSIDVRVEFCSSKCHPATKSVETLCFERSGNPYCIHLGRDNNETPSVKLNVSVDSEATNVSCSYTVQSVADDNRTVPLSRCAIENVTEDCPPFCRVKTFDVDGESCEIAWRQRLPTLATAFAVFMCFQVFVAICFSLTEATTLAMVKEHKDDYGRQRVWAILATAIFSPLTGVLVDVVSAYNGRTDYSPAFYVFDFLIICNMVLVYILNLPVVPPAKNIVKNIKNLIVVPEVVVFLIVIFFLGTFWGFLESFLFWHLLDLGSPKYLLGLTLTVGAIVGLPFLYTSDFFVRKFGRVNLLIVAFFFYAIRCIGYSYIHNPWWFVLFEAMEASTYHLMWVAAATYAAGLAPKGLLATIQGCVAGMHFGIGRGSGSLIGGNLISAFRNRIAFRSMGVASAILGVLYAIIYYGLLRNLKTRKEKDDETVTEKELSKVEISEKKSSLTNEEKF
ncbi:LOW QUALITY PROTEIN: major facilitator superfamily domain-containing protein 6-like [Centruroides vittatus]|uniref:LOW QUALITY PROTEIN: major facilitator superfamily domain-containing protein 6-like n=1 Tax=Centruroides vittatus TaxID=120091 RepID=UPI00351070F5